MCIYLNLMILIKIIRGFISTEHVNVKTVIKTVFKDSECAAAPVPADAVSELRRYATGINTRAGGAASAATDR